MGKCLKPWLFGSGGALALPLLCLFIGAGIETRRRWVTRELTRLLKEGETLNEVALRIPRDNKTVVLAFWRKYKDWSDSVVANLSEADCAHFQSLDRGQIPNSSDFSQLTDAQVYEAPGRVAVLRTIVNRLRG